MPAERPFVRMVARWACLGGVVLLAAVPIYLYVEPAWRALVARLASAIVLGVALLELRTALADRLPPRGASALDDARGRPGPEPAVPLRFFDLINDVRAALRSGRHFEKVLWPRLAALTPRPLVRPRVRHGRGPSLATLRDVITTIEKPS